MLTRERIEALIAMCEQGKFIDAIEEFYDDGATMQENGGPLRIGKAALIENERRVLRSIKEIRVNRANSFLVDGNRAAINWIYEFIDEEGYTFRRNEIAYQRWQNGQIVEERFYYDPAETVRLS